jgi:hypothetical protein
MIAGQGFAYCRFSCFVCSSAKRKYAEVKVVKEQNTSVICAELRTFNIVLSRIYFKKVVYGHEHVCRHAYTETKFPK